MFNNLQDKERIENLETTVELFRLGIVKRDTSASEWKAMVNDFMYRAEKLKNEFDALNGLLEKWRTAR